MALKPALWYPIAVALAVVNVVAAGFAYTPGDPMHAALHVGLAIASGLWAARLRTGVGTRALEQEIETLQLEVADLRQALFELQERMEFAERLLVEQPPARREPA